MKERLTNAQVVGDFHNSWDEINKIGFFEDFDEDFVLSLNQEFLQKYKQYKQNKGETDDQ